MTPQELKNSILQLAIQGKLVEQRVEEGTAEELYMQIQEEKQKLIKEGKIKKQKALPEITEDETPFDIPDTWKWVRTGEIGSWGSGATPSRSNPDYYGGNIPWLKTGDLNDGIVTEVPEMITELALQKTSVRLNPVGCVLMAMYGATIGKLCINAVPLTTNQACCACICFDGIYNKYLFYYLMAIRRNFIGMAEGGAQPNISKEKIVNSVFPLPPLQEQKRIVAKIEQLLPYIDKYEKAWTKLEEFNKKFPDDMQKSILQMAIQGKLVEQRKEEGTAEELYKQIQEEKQKLIKAGKIKKEKELPKITDDEIPFDIPDSWKWVRLGNLVQIISGISYKKGDVQKTGIRVLRGGNIQDNEIILDEDDIFLPENYYDEQKQVQRGDILFVASTGSKAVIGKPGFVKTEIEKTQIGAFLRICRVHDLGITDYIQCIFASEYYRKHIRNLAQGTNINNVKESYVTELVIPMPPLKEQKRIVAKIEELLLLCERLK